MGFIFQIFASPLHAILPMMIILACYGSKIKLPLSLPAGFVAALVGVALVWGFKSIGWVDFKPPTDKWEFAFYGPTPSISELFEVLKSPITLNMLSVIIPMGLFNAIGSLQNLESAASAGDNYKSKPSLLMNGAGTIVASLFSSPFPTTIYIGHPAWKSMGARAGYSVVNGLVMFLLCSIGAVTLVLKIMPLEVSLGIMLWIGIIIIAQCFKDTPKEHGLAVVIGLIPSLAAWGFLLIETSLVTAGSSMHAAFLNFGKNLYIHGVISLERGFLITSLCFSGLMVCILEQKFSKATIWTGALTLLSFFGLIHAYTVEPSGVQYKIGLFAAPKFVGAYLLCTCLMFFLAYVKKNNEKLER